MNWFFERMSLELQIMYERASEHPILSIAGAIAISYLVYMFVKSGIESEREKAKQLKQQHE